MAVGGAGVRIHGAGWLVGLGVAAAVVLSGCGSSGSPAAVVVSLQPAGASGQPAPSLGSVFDKPIPDSVASIPFVDQHGRTVSLAALRGKTVVLADFLTLCQEICPLTSTILHQVATATEAAGLSSSVVVVEATVDPQRDTPSRLAAYEKLYGALPNWELLTGTPAQVAALWKEFGASYDKVAEPAGPAPIDWMSGQPLTFDVEHQDVVFVIGPDGHEKWLVSGNPNTDGAKPPSTLWDFLNDDGQTNYSAPPSKSWTAADVEQAVSYVTGHSL
jgi:cytochrome oxidase Cu insertion factor (SCO1/SenC/PrrC family)